MAALAVSPSAHLLHILNYRLASDEAAAIGVSGTLDILDETHLITEVQEEAASANAQDSERIHSILHRWTLRLGALSSSKIAAVQATGFDLALETSRQSESIFLQHAKAWFASALAIVTRKTPAPLSAFLAASEFLLLSFSKAQHLPEFAREVANAGAVRKTGEGLLNFAGSEACDISLRVFALDYLSELITISASPLRPVSQSIQNVAVSLLCTWSSDENLTEASRSASRLLSKVYIISGKAQAGQSWRKTVESLIGSSHLLLHSMASTTIEEQGHPIPPALDLPPLASTSAPSGLAQQGVLLQATYQRFQALVDTIIIMLSSSTERAVPVPIGCVVRLCYRLLSLNTVNPTQERHDPNLRMAQLALLPQLHEQACRLLGQLTSRYMSTEANQLFYQVAYLVRTYPARSPTRSSLQALASVLLEYTHLHPDNGSEPLTKIIQSILQDAAPLVDPEEGRSKSASVSTHKGQNGNIDRKAKRARLFEADQVMSSRRRTTRQEAELIGHSFYSLYRILLHASWLLTSSLLTQTIRLLLAYSLSPQFLNAPQDYPTSSLLSEGLAYAPHIRLRVLQCLVTAAHHLPKESQGYLEHILSVLRCASQSSIIGEEGRAVCTTGMASIDNLLRPVVPPLVKSVHLRQATKDATADMGQTNEKKSLVNDNQLDQPAVPGTPHIPYAGDTASGRAAARLPLQSHLHLGDPAPASDGEVRDSSKGRPATLVMPKLPSRQGGSSALGTSLSSTVVSTPATTAETASLESTMQEASAAHAAPVSLVVPAIAMSTVKRDATDVSESRNLKTEVTEVSSQLDVDSDRNASAGAQAALVNATWDDGNVGDSSDDDDDAPMPAIYMSSDEESEEQDGNEVDGP